MAFFSSSRRWIAPVLLAAVTATTASTFSTDVRADEVSPKGKGIAGGVLLGAETAMTIEAIIGLRPWWAYLIGGVVGGAGGGLGGYYLEKSSTDGKAPTYLLAGGLAMFIPALVLTINATRYIPEEGAVEDKAPTSRLPGDPLARLASKPSTPRSSSASKAIDARARIASSLVDVTSGSFRLGLPLPTVRPMLDSKEQQRIQAQQGTEVRMPIVNVVF